MLKAFGFKNKPVSPFIEWGLWLQLFPVPPKPSVDDEVVKSEVVDHEIEASLHLPSFVLPLPCSVLDQYVAR